MGLGLMLGCNQPSTSAPDDVGAIMLSIMQAPSDARCLRLTATGSRTAIRLLDLTPGSSTAFHIGGLPLGPVQFLGEAFSIGCGSVTASNVPSWISDPVDATISLASVAEVTLTLRRNGRADVNADFDEDPNCTPALGCNTTCHPTGAELCDGIDNDCNGAVDDGANLCPLANGLGACVMGACRTTSCNGGFADCDANATDGCETNLLTSVANCGGCGRTCLAGQVCQSGVCVAQCDPATEVLFNNHCYYLDGSGGTCDAGYALASQSVLSSIAMSFAGKTYKHTVSDACCIFNADPVEDWGVVFFPGHCNQPGPFAATDVVLGGANCTGVTLKFPHELTLCFK